MRAGYRRGSERLSMAEFTGRLPAELRKAGIGTATVLGGSGIVRIYL